MTKRCLIISDMQQGFMNEHTEILIPEIRELIDKSDYPWVVATKFFNMEESPFRTILSWDGMSTAQETRFVDGFGDGIHMFFDKTRWSCVNDQMLRFIHGNGITDIDMVGIDTESAVLQSVVGFFENNINVRVLAAFCASSKGKVRHAAALSVLSTLIGSKNIIH